jgi:FHS family L-fucose permease-like MFS transporter
MILGEPETATQRLNFSQSFNGLAAFLAPLLGGQFILSGKNLTAEQEASMTPEALSAYLDHEAASVQVPYIIIGSVVLLVALILWKTKLPDIVHHDDDPEGPEAHENVFRNANLTWGLLAQFFYVGGQVCVMSFFIRFASSAGGLFEKSAANYLAIGGGLFMAGRFIGTFLMKYIAPAKLLLIYSIITILLLGLAIVNDGMIAVYAVMIVFFFMSIMFPTIFSLGLLGLDAETKKKGSSLLIMTIIGGAILPVIMGRVVDVKNIQVAYVIPAFCFVVVGYFALRNIGSKTVDVSMVH